MEEGELERASRDSAFEEVVEGVTAVEEVSIINHDLGLKLQ